MCSSDNPDKAFTATISRWIAETPALLVEGSVDRAERAVVDTIGCIVAGANDDAVQRVKKGIEQYGTNGASSQIGTTQGIDAPWAAMVNATAAHALDYDDVLDPAASHVSAAIVPALLALAEEIDASGAAFIDAYIAGVEVQACLADAVNMIHYNRGWHTTLTLGAPAAAAACARLLKLDAEACRNALSIATSSSAGYKRQFGTNTKPLHAGLAAKSGILAARLAAAGLTADAAPFEGERGFFDLMAGPGAKGFGEVAGRLRGPLAIEAPGIWQKRYPCCASTHRAVDGFLQLMREHALRSDDIKHVELCVSEAAVRNLMFDTPEDPMQARFSMHYCIASAAYEGDLKLAGFQQPAMNRAEVMAFMGRVEMTADSDQPATMPASVKSWATTHITTEGGKRLSVKVTDPKGYPDNPLSEQELAAKFQDCLSHGKLTEDQVAYHPWRNVGSAASMRALCQMLRSKAL